MAPHKEVKSLKNLCFQAFEKSLVSVCNDALDHEILADVNAAEILRKSRLAMYEDTPQTLHHDLGNYCLKALNNWYNSVEKKLKDQMIDQMKKAKTVVSRLAELIPNKKMKNMVDEKLCKPVTEAILRNLGRMSELEDFDWDNFDGVTPESMQKYLSDSANSLSNLRNFSVSVRCNDEIVKIICQNCPEIREICVACCEEVTDDCIDSLLLCPKLEELVMQQTSVTSAGFARIIQESESLKKLYLVDKGMEIIAILKETCPSRTYNLRSFGDTFSYNEDLRAVANFFPSLSSVDVYSEEANIFNDITLNLKEINIMAPSLNLIFNSLTSFLSVRGSSITKLDLDTSDEVTGQKIFDICALCPNIEELTIARFKLSSVDYEDRIDNFADLHTRNPTLLSLIRSHNPFKKLKKLTVDFDKTLLQYTPNVEEVDIYCTSLSDEFFQNLFLFNQLECMKRLAYFSQDKLSANAFKTIIINCKKLEHIECRTKRTNEMEAIIDEVQLFIAANSYAVNFDVDLSW